MARLFELAQDEYLQLNSAPVVGAPFTVSCRFYMTDVSVAGTLFFLGDKDKAYTWCHIQVVGTTAGDPIRGLIRDITAHPAFTTNGVTVNTWHHVIYREISTSSRKVTLDGDYANQGVDTHTVVPTGFDRVAIGMMRDLTPVSPFPGLIADVALWNAALTDDEGTSLTNGVHPNFIRPSARVSFWPLGGFDTQETDGGAARDIWGGYDLTAYSNATGPGIADHPVGLIYPVAPLVFSGTSQTSQTLPVGFSKSIPVSWTSEINSFAQCGVSYIGELGVNIGSPVDWVSLSAQKFGIIPVSWGLVSAATTSPLSGGIWILDARGTTWVVDSRGTIWELDSRNTTWTLPVRY